MTPLGVVANLVVCAEANPVGDGPVLLGLLGQLLLDDKRLVGRHFCRCPTSIDGDKRKNDSLRKEAYVGLLAKKQPPGLKLVHAWDELQPQAPKSPSHKLHVQIHVAVCIAGAGCHMVFLLKVCLRVLMVLVV